MVSIFNCMPGISASLFFPVGLSGKPVYYVYIWSRLVYDPYPVLVYSE